MADLPGREVYAPPHDFNLFLVFAGSEHGVAVFPLLDEGSYI